LAAGQPIRTAHLLAPFMKQFVLLAIICFSLCQNFKESTMAGRRNDVAAILHGGTRWRMTLCVYGPRLILLLSWIILLFLPLILLIINGHTKTAVWVQLGLTGFCWILSFTIAFISSEIENSKIWLSFIHLLMAVMTSVFSLVGAFLTPARDPPQCEELDPRRPFGCVVGEEFTQGQTLIWNLLATMCTGFSWAIVLSLHCRIVWHAADVILQRLLHDQRMAPRRKWTRQR
jgi:hypothetical protein